MPELPEVETIRRDLKSLLLGKVFSRADVHDLRALEGFGPDGSRRRRVDAAAFERRLAGRALKDVSRRGKYLLFHLNDGGALLAHLRMTGQLLYGAPRPKARVHLHFKGGADVLSYCDTRRFGELWIAEDWREDPSIRALGPEPLGESILDAAEWGRSLRGSSARMQSVLLDQKRIAGLGNIYVTEALWRTGLRPTRRANTLRAADVAPLLKHVRAVLEEGLKFRGVSFRDYRDARGEKGRAKDRLAVYGKAGRPCPRPRCGGTLKGVKISGRGTVYCPSCQR
jgi:formamidopyrimidine-DNA glycosylase